MDTSLPETYKAVIGKRDGGRGELQDVPMQKPGKNEVLIKVEFAPINPSDMGTAMGFYPVYPPPNSIPENVPTRVGLEGSGTIVAVGEDCIIKHELGTKVSFFTLGSWGQYIIVPSERCIPVQPGVSMEQAACIGNPATCIHLFDLTVKGGHKAAIQNAASSALGRMMIRYFKLKGVKLINIVRKNEYIDELLKEGADYVLNQEDEEFPIKLKEIAAKESATIAFDSIGGDMLGTILWCMPPESEIRLLGAFSMKPIQASIQDLLFEGKTIKGVWVTRFLQSLKPDEAHKFFTEIASMIKDTLKSNIAKKFKLEDFQAALKAYKELSGKGKILLCPWGNVE